MTCGLHQFVFWILKKIASFSLFLLITHRLLHIITKLRLSLQIFDVQQWLFTSKWYLDAQVHTIVSFPFGITNTILPLYCTKTPRLCNSFLVFSVSSNQTLDMIISMFHAFSQRYSWRQQSQPCFWLDEQFMC